MVVRTLRAPNPSGRAAHVPEGPAPIVVMASNLPSRSQTFVSQEILALRARGARVLPVTVRRNPFVPDIEGQLGGVHAILEKGFVRDVVRGAAMRPRALASIVRELASGPFPRRADMVRTAFHVAEGLALGVHLRRVGAGYVHAHHADGAVTTAMVASRLARVPFGFTAHGSDVHSNALLLAQKMRSAALVVAASDHISAGLSAYDPQARIRVIRCGVPLGRFAAPVRRRATGPLRLLHVGRLIPVKDQATLIEAVAVLVGRGVALELRIVGEGPERADLERRIAEHGLGECVRLLGALPNERLPEIYEWADAFVMSSLREGLPVVLVEALASGLPVVATRISGIPELVREGREGFLVAPSDPPALADAIARLVDFELRESLGLSGVERARMHDLDEIARDLLDAYPVGAPPAPEDSGHAATLVQDPALVPTIGAPLPVSVVVSGARDGAALRASLASVVSQRPRLPAEIVVVATGADGLVDTAREFGARTVLAPAGTDALASGLVEAAQPWIATLDARDRWLPHSLAMLWEMRDDEKIVAGSAVLCADASDDDHRARSEGPLATMASGALMRSDTVRVAGGLVVAPRVPRVVSARPSVIRSGAPRTGSRRAWDVARDGGPAVALLPADGPMLDAARRLVGDRPVVDLSSQGRLRAYARLLRRPPAMAFATSPLDVVVLRALGIRPLHADRAESQTRSSKVAP